MFNLQSITFYYATHGQLRKSQQTTLAALVWALIRQPLLGIAAMGHSLAMAVLANSFCHRFDSLCCHRSRQIEENSRNTIRPYPFIRVWLGREVWPHAKRESQSTGLNPVGYCVSRVPRIG